MKITLTIDEGDVEHLAARVAERLEQIIKAYSRPTHEGHDVLLTAQQAGELLRLAPQTLAIYRCKGGGPVFQRIGRRVMYRRRAIDAWLKEREFPHTSAYQTQRSA